MDLARARVGRKRLPEARGGGHPRARGELRAHGISTHGSTIIGLEHHTPSNIDADIDRAIAHDTVFHRFMLYTPMPGTALHAQVAAEGRLLDDVAIADIHGQFKFNFRHPAISRDESKVLLDRAFWLDFERNGPSLYRLMRTMFEGWHRYRADADPRVRARVAVAAAQLRGGYGAALWGMEHYLRASNPAVGERIRRLRVDVEREFGLASRVVNRTLGPLLLWGSRREARRHPGGPRLEPATFVDRRPVLQT